MNPVNAGMVWQRLSLFLQPYLFPPSKDMEVPLDGRGTLLFLIAWLDMGLKAVDLCDY